MYMYLPLTAYVRNGLFPGIIDLAFVLSIMHKMKAMLPRQLIINNPSDDKGKL